MKKSLKDKVVFITGASSGFGADFGRRFAQEGAIVILAARRMDRLTALAEEIRLAGGQAFPLALDVTEKSQVEDAVHNVFDKFGRVDILINNAGLGRLDWLERIDPETGIDRQMDVNLVAAIQLTRALLPSMQARRAGHIINISSVAGLIAAPMYTVYAASKFGLRGFTVALRRELIPFHIQVSGVFPGGAVTEFGKQSGDNALKQNYNLPGWLSMSSDYVARKTVGLARRPRRTMILPWWYGILVAFDTLFPWLVDWMVNILFVNKWHHP
jgi:short-subunit dehydrogenase